MYMVIVKCQTVPNKTLHIQIVRKARGTWQCPNISRRRDDEKRK